MEKPGDYRIILRPEPNATPAIVRLRHALKAFLRAYGLRAIEVEEVPEQTPAPAAAQDRPG